MTRAIQEVMNRFQIDRHEFVQFTFLGLPCAGGEQGSGVQVIWYRKSKWNRKPGQIHARRVVFTTYLTRVHSPLVRHQVNVIGSCCLLFGLFCNRLISLVLIIKDIPLYQLYQCHICNTGSAHRLDHERVLSKYRYPSPPLSGDQR